MTTPEGKMKRRVSALLKAYEPELYYWMPVPGGYGESTLDYVGCLHGKFFAIETKAPDKKPTPRQLQIANRMILAGADVFIVGTDEQLECLHRWLEKNHEPRSNISQAQDYRFTLPE